MSLRTREPAPTDTEEAQPGGDWRCCPLLTRPQSFDSVPRRICGEPFNKSPACSPRTFPERRRSTGGYARTRGSRGRASRSWVPGRTHPGVRQFIYPCEDRHGAVDDVDDVVFGMGVGPGPLVLGSSHHSEMAHRLAVWAPPALNTARIRPMSWLRPSPGARATGLLVEALLIDRCSLEAQARVGR